MSRLHPRQLTVSRVPTAYAVLGVSPGMAIRDIHTIYKKLAVEQHPDHGGDGERFAQITCAFGVIKDAGRRERYDVQLRMMGRLNCKTCDGTGLRKTYHKRKLIPIPCELCRGTGEDDGNRAR